MGVAALIAWIGTIITGEFYHAPLLLEAIEAEFYLAIFGSLIAFTAYIYLAQAWPPARMGTYAYLNPVVAVILGTSMLGESYGLRKIIGFAVILAAVATVQLKNRNVSH
jgi:drug/metabolite transporter (DMT)-like permease